MDPAEKYVKQVLDNKILTCDYIKMACQRHLDDLNNQKNLGLVWKPEIGDRILEYSSYLRHWKGSKAGQRIELQPHQQFYFQSLYGWHKYNSEGELVRRFRTSYKEVARKNGKTSECAIKSLYHLDLDNEAGAQAYFVATKEEQARIGFQDVQEIAKKSGLTSSGFKVYTKSVTYEQKGSFIKPLGSDSNTQDGFDPSLGIIDEYHAHKNDRMLNVIESGMGARKQPLIDIITTAGFNKEGPCFSLRKVCIDILEGKLTDNGLFALIYTLDEDDDWENPEVWIKSNPNLDVSVNKDFLKDRFIKAKNEGGSKEVDFKTKNLNIWTDASSVWIPDDEYMTCNLEEDEQVLIGRPCYGGIDLAKSIDLNAFALFFPSEDTDSEPHRAKLFFWIPEDKAKPENNKDGVDYPKWIDEGHIFSTKGGIVDHRFVTKTVCDLRASYDINSIAVDPSHTYHGVVQDLGDEEFEIVSYGQGHKNYNDPLCEFESMVKQQSFNHFGNPVLRWMVGNVEISTNHEGKRKPDKAKSINKIDGVAALLMAIGEWMRVRKESGSNYDERGILYL